MTELTDQELLQATPEEIEFYNKCIEGLPSIHGINGDGLGVDGNPIPYGSGPHITKHFKEVIEIVKPTRILEIGFNIGYSAALWLNLFDGHLDSIDISVREETIYAAGYLDHKYGNPIVRFEYFNRTLFNGDAKYYDLCFIDGAHDVESIINDILLAINLEIPFLLFDDWYPRFSDAQMAVAHFPELELIKDMNNLRLYKVNYE